MRPARRSRPQGAFAWDVAQYERFKDERARPFTDLLARLPALQAQRVADLGCGTGELTERLSDRWPGALVVGVDTSAQMLATAVRRARPRRLAFLMADAAAWRPAVPLDLVVSNATFQWIDDHRRLLDHSLGLLAPGGVLAVQMPGNFQAPSHVELAATARRAEWAHLLSPLLRPSPVEDASWYARALLAAGATEVDAWETVYVHVLKGRDAVLEWMKGTALRPFLARLDPRGAERFLSVLRARLAAAYPPGPAGTLLPFRRIFFVARRGARRRRA